MDDAPYAPDGARFQHFEMYELTPPGFNHESCCTFLCRFDDEAGQSDLWRCRQVYVGSDDRLLRRFARGTWSIIRGTPSEFAWVKEAEAVVALRERTERAKGKP